MGQGYQGLDTVLIELIKDFVIEGQSFFIGFQLITLWKNPWPGDGQTEGLKAHFGIEGDVFLVTVVKIRTPAFWIEAFCILKGKIQSFTVHGCGKFSSHGLALFWIDCPGCIRGRKAAASLTKAPFKLVGGGCPTPKETIWKSFVFCHILTSLFKFLSFAACTFRMQEATHAFSSF